MASEWFHCAICHGTFPKGWSDDDAMAEAEREGVDLATAVIVCEDCYHKANTP